MVMNFTSTNKKKSERKSYRTITTVTVETYSKE